MKTPDPSLLKKAENGDVLACYMLGVWHGKAIRSVADAHANQALHWLWRSHQLGNTKAADLLTPLQRCVKGVQDKMPSRSIRGFVCKRCGKCCSMSDAIEISLDPRDIRRWKREGRTDILNYTTRLELDSYEGWFSPKTGDELIRCPWHHKFKGRSTCLIQDTKPMLCQNYPLTKRHALKNGCEGYIIEGASNDLVVTCPSCQMDHALKKDYLIKPNVKCPCGTKGIIEFEEDLWEISRQVSNGWKSAHIIELIGRPIRIDHCTVILEQGSYETKIFIQWCSGFQEK